MRNQIIGCLLVSIVFLTNACSSTQDSTQITQEVNKKNIERGEPYTAQSVSASSETGQENVAKYMVDLSNAELTKFKLSELASQRAATPTVKDFARQIVRQYSLEKRRALTTQARQYRIGLPTALSDDSQAMVAMLQQEEPGPDFDKQYLRFMAELNDNSVSKARNLINNTDKPALMSFIENLMAVNQQDMDKAIELKSAVN
ncbi:DUF4142 domain-containing protein [Spirosoma fluminis]